MSTADRIRAALEANGISNHPVERESDIHSWRCAYPARYGTCTCFEDLVNDLLEAITVPASKDNTMKTPQTIAAETVERIAARDAQHLTGDHAIGLATKAIAADRAQIADALTRRDPVPGIRPFSSPSVSQLIDAFAEWDGEVDTFVTAWDEILAGRDFPCPAHPAGIHSTYLADDRSCSSCGDKNRG